jgi:hypothetical protein
LKLFLEGNSFFFARGKIEIRGNDFKQNLKNMEYEKGGKFEKLVETFPGNSGASLSGFSRIFMNFKFASLID